MDKSLNFNHQTHKHTLIKFLGLIVIIVVYFLYMTHKYSLGKGGNITALTWSFFVLCTPVADAGFLIAFPVRLLFGFRMALTQIVVLFVAISLNVYMLIYAPEQYDFVFITSLLKHILIQPYPYWIILILSLLGTMLSIYFADEVIDVSSYQQCHKQHQHGYKYRFVLIAAGLILIIVAYYYLLNSLGLSLSD